MLNIGNKTFMNLQEAVGWLLENNALPFQSTADYVGNTEIAMSTLVNPSPAKVRVGSLIFFADSKVATVIGVTSNSFIVSDEYNDLVDDIVYVSNVAINASGHLICTLSNGDTIDAGLIKQINNFSIDGSQHLIANYNDGTSTDLGAIFSGNVNIAGNFTADSIIENMVGYSFTRGWTGVDYDYVGVAKTGNKITLVVAGHFNQSANFDAYASKSLGQFTIPSSVGVNIFPINSNNDIAFIRIFSFDSNYYDFKQFTGYLTKDDSQHLSVKIGNGATAIDTTWKGSFRIEATFLLGTNLAS